MQARAAYNRAGHGDSRRRPSTGVWRLSWICAALVGSTLLSAAAADQMVSNGGELQRALGQSFAAAFPDRPPMWELPREHDFTRSGAAALALRAPDELQGGRNWFRLQGAAAGKSYLLPVDLFWEDTVWVATRALRTRHCLTARDCERRFVRHTLRPDELLGGGPPTGLCLRRSVSAGQTLSRALLAPPPLIERGRIVRLLYQNAGLTVSARAEALEDGGVGEAIRVRPIDSRRTCQAIVRTTDEVEVILP